jgi:hypothetical protein
MNAKIAIGTLIAALPAGAGTGAVLLAAMTLFLIEGKDIFERLTRGFRSKSSKYRRGGKKQ